MKVVPIQASPNVPASTSPSGKCSCFRDCSRIQLDHVWNFVVVATSGLGNLTIINGKRLQVRGRSPLLVMPIKLLLIKSPDCFTCSVVIQVSTTVPPKKSATREGWMIFGNWKSKRHALQMTSFDASASYYDVSSKPMYSLILVFVKCVCPSKGTVVHALPFFKQIYPRSWIMAEGKSPQPSVPFPAGSFAPRPISTTAII